MPLPPALAARLAKRGIIKEQPAPDPPISKAVEEIEEVFAEDYDDPAKPEPADTETRMEEDEKEESDKEEEEEEDYVHEVINCPNRSNPYHTCVKYCHNRWGMKTFTPDPDMLKKRDRMLRKYPLPDGWKEVADPDTGRFYYWSIQTDQVCWLSPGHPKSIISMPAEKLSESLVSAVEGEGEDQEDEGLEMRDDEPMEADSDMSGSSSSDSDSDEDRRRSRRERDADAERSRLDSRSRGGRQDRDNRRGRNRREEIDPMDPAAYSDIPRGGWTDGLDTRGQRRQAWT